MVQLDSQAAEALVQRLEDAAYTVRYVVYEQYHICQMSVYSPSVDEHITTPCEPASAIAQA